jgi:hypothetical protein
MADLGLHIPGDADRRGLARSVASDLEGIFAPEAATRSTTPSAVRRVAGRGDARGPATIGALLVAGLLGVTAGSLLMKAPGFSKPNPVMAAATPQAAPLQGYPWSPEPFAPLVPAMVQPVSAPAPARVEAPRPAKVARKPAKPRSAPGCRRGCTYAEVMAADRRLRRAYAGAIRAGVSRGALVSYRNRWAQLRPRARYEPQRVVVGYGALASDLDRMAGRSRRS